MLLFHRNLNLTVPETPTENVHVVVLENEPSSCRGGQELSLLEVCRGLSQRGHSISLLYLKPGDLLNQYQDFCANISKVDSYLLDRSNIHHTLTFLINIHNVPIHRNTIVYSNRYHDVFFGYMLSLLKNIPSVCHLRLPPPHKFGRPHAIGIKGTKQFITTSEQTKLDWVNSGVKAKKIQVVHNAIDLEKFKISENFYQVRKEWNLPVDIKIISYVGRLDKEKGLESLIKAFALVQKRFSKTRLLIAGKPLSTEENYKGFLEQLTIDLDIEKYVDFLGHINNPVSLYQASDITVLPSLWSEPFGRAIIESMACGTPVVASRTGGIPEILTGEFQSGLFEPGDEEDLLDKITNLLNWRETAPQFGKRCREHVLRKFCPEKMVDSIEEILLRVANKSAVSI